MEFWFWFQICIAVVIGNGLTASIAYFFIRLYRHEFLHKKSMETLPPWVFLFFLIPAGLAIVVVAGFQL